MAAPTIQAAGLSKTFGRRAAVSGVDFALSAGECLALFGPNGAGKTTLLRLLAGLLRPSSGSAKIHDIDVRRDHAARAAVGLISHQSMLYGALTARENVEFSARLYGVRDAIAASQVSLERMRVLEVADVPVRTLSRGLQQRVSIARAIVHEPRVLLLDEPYSGLDEAGANALTAVLTSLRSSERHATLIVVTHNVAEGLALATHAAIMKNGRFVRFERRDDRSAFDAPRYAAEYRELVSRAS